MSSDERHRERSIRIRLSPHGLTGKVPVCGFYHKDDQAIVKRLEAEGLVTTWPGEGKDQGLLLAQLVPTKPALVATVTGDAG